MSREGTLWEFILFIKGVFWMILEVLLNPVKRFLGLFGSMVTGQLDGKVIVITGATSGIGKATTRILVEKGARVIMACRDTAKADRFRTELLASTRDAKVDIIQLNLASLDSVRECAGALNREEKIDVLINNAGVWIPKRTKTEDGHEINMGVNHLGHFLLTLLLLKKLIANKAKVVNVSSIVHILTVLKFEGHQLVQNYVPALGYPKSKLAQVMFTRELARRCPQINVYAVHPGTVSTELTRDFATRRTNILFDFMERTFFRSPEEGALTTLHCTVSPQAEGQTGLYYVDCDVVKPSADAESAEKCRLLWMASLKLVGLDEPNFVETL